jgi:DNA-binding transcriptional ArsR family regulator
MEEQQTASPTTPPPALLVALKRAQERSRELESFIRWEDDLFANPHLSGNHKLEIRATRRAVQRAQTRDEQGRARINLTTIAQQIGVSPDTMSRGLKVLEQCGVIADKVTRPEIQENGERWTRHYVTLDEQVLARPKEIQPPEPRNHGGNRYRCQHCGSDQVRIKRRVTLICQHCNHESLIEESEREQEAENSEQESAKNFDEQDRNLQDILKPVTPPCGAEQTPGDPASEGEAAPDQDDLRAAAELLLALAGQSDEHIEMSRTGFKKYYTVGRPLALSDLLDHLQGGKARGARCSYADGQTRGLGFDADDAQRWQRLEQAARHLAEAGYLPILEPSPGREIGGHLWVIYDGLVDANAARQHVYALAPELADIAEYWPGPQDAKKWNRVRLPGGKYVRPGISAWCELVAVATGEQSRDGRSAARLLLDNQTPAAIVPAQQLADVQPETIDQAQQERMDVPAADPLPDSEQPPAGAIAPDQVDTQWHARYSTPEGQRLWFAWTPQYLATWWNSRHSINDLLPSERNGYGLASWRGERTASVAKRGEQWTDFGASARQSNGSPDTGDALELQVRLAGTSKADVMRQAARELLHDARQTLEQAARSGQQLPAWIEEIITEAGRAHYARVASQAGHVEQPAPAQAEQNETSAIRNENVLRIDAQAPAADGDRQPGPDTGGLPGFSTPLAPGPQSNLLPGSTARQLRDSALAVPSSLPPDIEQLEAIKRYGESRQWAALVLDGEELIPAGRPAWLRFIWISGKKEQQRRVYEHLIRANSERCQDML